LKKKTISSMVAILFLLAALLTVFSFLQRGSSLIKINQFLIFWFGGAAVFLPFLMLSVGLFFSQIETPFKQPNVALGTLLLILAFAGLIKGGQAGNLIWGELQFLITNVGAFFFLIFTFLIGLVILFNTSLDKLITFLIGAVMMVKNRLVSPKAEEEKGPVFVSQEKGEEKKKAAPSPGIVAPLSLKETSSLTTTPPAKKKAWRYPPIDILKSVVDGKADRGNVKENADVVEKTLDSFGIMARVAEINEGPAVTQYALEVALGTKLSKITALSNDLALALAAPTGQIRIEAPIPGRSLVGIEVPNRSPRIVGLKEMLVSSLMQKADSKLIVPLGLDVSGSPRVADVGRMPHVLIAGQTGSGKSVLINSWIVSLLMRTTPDEVRLILIDPKRVEMTRYNGIPHLLAPVIHDPSEVVSALRWTIGEMDNRYKLFAEMGARNIEAYNEMAGFQSLPYIFIFIDELADIMLFAPAEVEDAICRIAQMARATGIHLILATQRPSVDVLTGLIKANIPCRLSFAVSSMTDSRVIIDCPGAEKLLGGGDMLYVPPTQAKPTRIQGPFVSDKEVGQLIDFLRSEREAVYDERVTTQPVSLSKSSTFMVNGEERDALFSEAAKMVVGEGKASASLFQRRLKIGYARAARILDQLESAGIVGPSQGSKAREVLVSALPEELKESDG